MTASLKPSKTRRAQAERSETMQRRLLDAAVAVLKRRGLAGFRTAEVVAMAGVSKGALLHHFTTTVSLIAAAFDWLREGTDESARYFHKARQRVVSGKRVSVGGDRVGRRIHKK